MDQSHVANINPNFQLECIKYSLSFVLLWDLFIYLEPIILGDGSLKVIFVNVNGLAPRQRQIADRFRELGVVKLFGHDEKAL